ncbi:hypothetical protein [Fluviicola sp.]|uniref:tetratricopeptide repeat protein n=1 Tax=Fluviicola sp. TaxID=1917219 RepID=UPI0031D259C2
MKPIGLFLLFLLFSLKCFSQPDPSLFYPGRILEITKELQYQAIQEDSSKYHALLWERAEMQVSLLVQSNVSTKRTDSTATKQLINDLNYLIDRDIKIGEGNFQTTKLDFLLNRGIFYSQSTNYQNALSDYLQIIEMDSSGRFREVALYRISITYFAIGNIDLALTYVDQILDENTSEKKFDNLFYACESGSSLINWKISILEKSGRKKELIQLYRKLIRQNRKIGWHDNAKCFSEGLKSLKEQ